MSKRKRKILYFLFDRTIRIKKSNKKVRQAIFSRFVSSEYVLIAFGALRLGV